MLPQNLIIYVFKNFFWAAHGFSLVAVSGSSSLVSMLGLLTAMSSLLEHRL